MNERIKLLRQSENLNQTDFGAKIGVQQTTIAGYENGSRTPSDAVLLSICREFNVSEKWLRTGEGEMFVPRSRDVELAAFFGEVLRGEAPDFRRRFIAALSRLSADDWDLLERMVTSLAEEMGKAPD